MDQVYRKTCFEPIYIKYLTTQEKRRVQEDIIILEENSTTKKTKRRMVFNGKPTRMWLSREDNSSTTESLDDIFKRQKTMHTRDRISWFWMLPMNSFRPTFHQKIYSEERVMMKITGVLLDMLLELDIDTYSNNVVFENRKNAI